MQPEPPFISNAQNREDVVLWRALHGVTGGRYVEVGANHPRDDSVSRAFYDRGWNGITVEPVPYFADLQRAERPRDHLAQVAVSNSSGDKITLHVITGTGLSTIVDVVNANHVRAGLDHVDVVVPTMRLDDVLTEPGWSPDDDIHFMLIDVEGAEADVLESIDLGRWRPWILVVESTAPNSTISTHELWEPGLLAADYEFCLFDGISRFYVATEKAADLKADLTYPACVLDNYQSLALTLALHERQELVAQATHWRTVALTHWADAVNRAANETGPEFDAELERLRAQVLAMESTLSWRVTRPIRLVRRALDRVRAR